MITVTNLTKVYGAQRAVDGLSFSVRPGEILGFLGPNGAGKSTTMKMIAGFVRPTGGTVALGAYSLDSHPLELRRRIGYLPEHNPLYLDMYVHEYLDFTGRIYGLDAAGRKRRTAEVIEQTGLGREQHKQIGMLSKGYRQRVGLCQALYHHPEVLILDEPTSGLDPNQIVDIRALIREAGRQAIVIFSSHILSEVEAIADRVLILNRGRKIADGPASMIPAMARNESRIELEVEREGLDLSGLQQLPGVLAVERISGTQFLIRTGADTDARRAIFTACAAADNAILALHRQVLSLEEAFRVLTAQPSDSEGPLDQQDDQAGRN